MRAVVPIDLRKLVRASEVVTKIAVFDKVIAVVRSVPKKINRGIRIACLRLGQRIAQVFTVGSMHEDDRQSAPGRPRCVRTARRCPWPTGPLDEFGGCVQRGPRYLARGGCPEPSGTSARISNECSTHAYETE